MPISRLYLGAFLGCGFIGASGCQDSVPRPAELQGRDVVTAALRPISLRTDSTSQLALGRRLFSDSTLSRDSSISCATCHSPFRAFTEARAKSHGVGARARIRNAPSLLNVSQHHPPFDWDGRAESLEKQLHGVFSIGGDMDITLLQAVDRIRGDPAYSRSFERIYGRPPDVETLVRALVAYERSLTDGESRFDRFYLGGDSAAFSEREKRGWDLFRTTKAGCAGCHTPIPDQLSGRILFQDYRFHNLGVGYDRGHASDVGRLAITGEPGDQGAFRTPSLRNVALTAPYMHDGSLATLEEVVAFYARGGTRNPRLDAVMGKRMLTERERGDLVAFLRTLTADGLTDSTVVREKFLR